MKFKIWYLKCDAAYEHGPWVEFASIHEHEVDTVLQAHAGFKNVQKCFVEVEVK